MEMKATWKMFYILVIFLAVTCQDVASQSVRWEKANTAPVCFGAKNTKFGVFRAPSSGRLAAVGLEHLYGYVTCSTASVSYWSFWGCGNHHVYKNAVGVIITTTNDHVLLPPSEFNIYGGMYYEIPGYKPNSPQLWMSFFSPLTFHVNAGDQLRLWYGEDFKGVTEGDNDGHVCCNVYTRIVV